MPLCPLLSSRTVKTLTLRGPNLWSRLTVIEAWLEFLPVTPVEGWPARLIGWMPELEGRVTVAADAGAAVLASWLTELTLVLQQRIGAPVEFGRTAGAPDAGVLRVIFQYDEEAVGRAALELARTSLDAALGGTEFNFGAALTELGDLANEVCLGPSTRAMVTAAVARGIPFQRLTEGSLVQLGHGSRQRRILAAATSQTGAIAEDIVQDKDLTRRILREVGLPVPAGRPVDSAADAWVAAQELGLPVVVKPRDGNQGRGVAVNLFTREQVMAAFAAAQEESASVIVEQFAEGLDYRLLVIGRELVAASRRQPAHVIGDGTHTVSELIEIENRDPRRASDHAAALSRIRIDAVALGVLAEQEVTPDSVPAKGRMVLIRRNANLSTGGTAEDVTDEVHPSIRDACIEAAQTVGLDICGIDLVANDISQPLSRRNGAIIELNARPGLRMHLYPSAGKARPVGDAVIGTLFAPEDNGRIPIVAVTGVNGKTTTTRFIAHLFEQTGATVGLTSTDGIFAGRRKLDEGDCSGPRSARTVLGNPLIDAAVLETARGGILREGLGFDRCQVAVITNIAGGDHLGCGGISTVEELAAVKSCILKAVAPDGYAVLNAADPLVAAMADHGQWQTIFFAVSGDHPVIVRHREAGGRALFTRESCVVRAHGRREEIIMPLAEIPLTHGGRIGFQVENSLAALAAAWGAGISDDAARAGARSFRPGMEQNAGRFNTFELRGLTVILDYGHNPSALARLVEALDNFPNAHRISVYSAPGDRRDEDMVEQGRLLGGAFDEVWLYEGDYCRGRQPGEIMDILAKGLDGAARTRRVEKIIGALRAIDVAIESAPSGSLLVIQPDTADETVQHLRSRWGAV